MNRKQEEFFKKLYQENYKDLTKYAFRLTLRSNYAEDVVQEAFFVAHKKNRNASAS